MSPRSDPHIYLHTPLASPRFIKQIGGISTDQPPVFLKQIRGKQGLNKLQRHPSNYSMPTTGTKRIRDDDQHQYAMNQKGEWIHARNGLKGVSYYCDCPEHHKQKLVAPSGREGKRTFAHYFAHQTSFDGKSSCMSNGESMKHRLAKHKIRELASTLSFDTEQCPKCKWTKQFHSDGHTVQIEIQSIDKQWRYDCLLFDSIGMQVFALEVVHTHFSSDEKINSTRSNVNGNLGFAEFMADDVMESVDGFLQNIQPVDCLDCPQCRVITESKVDEAKRKLCKLASQISFVSAACSTCKWLERFHSTGHSVSYPDLNLLDTSGNAVYTFAVAEFAVNIDPTKKGSATFLVDDIIQSTTGRLSNLQIGSVTNCSNCQKIAVEQATQASMKERESHWRAMAQPAKRISISQHPFFYKINNNKL